MPLRYKNQKSLYKSYCVVTDQKDSCSSDNLKDKELVS